MNERTIVEKFRGRGGIIQSGNDVKSEGVSETGRRVRTVKETSEGWTGVSLPEHELRSGTGAAESGSGGKGGESAVLHMETVSRQRELGQESVQLRALNERLECYLQRVAVLEKENSTLRDHIQALKPGPDGGRRKELEAELEALRQELSEGLRETDRAALQRDALLEEVRLVAERCCGEARLRTSAEKELAERRRWLEEEQRGRKGLEGKVRMFQDELGHLEEVQREERNVLLQETARSSLRCPTAPVAAISPPDLRLCLGEVDLKWTEARDLYRDELTRLERVVSEAGLRQEAAREETRLNRHRLQGLRGELEALREKRRQLEERLRQQNRASEQDTQRLQVRRLELGGARERETTTVQLAALEGSLRSPRPEAGCVGGSGRGRVRNGERHPRG
ncbi:tanabin-like [Hypanus sabinus]|uniref:tanabin-like n=1 Tax=Hypanus sabinus TaxID=79690 RepID=UPI0028C3F280|nr:tanabin-like [Hypanus sabinus]